MEARAREALASFRRSVERRRLNDIIATPKGGRAESAVEYAKHKLLSLGDPKADITRAIEGDGGLIGGANLPTDLDGWSHAESVDVSKIPPKVFLFFSVASDTNTVDPGLGRFESDANIIYVFNANESEAETTLHHELIHMAQWWLTAGRGFSPDERLLGGPSRKIPFDELTRQHYDLPHAARDIEFYPRIQDEVHRFAEYAQRWKHHHVRDRDSVGHWIKSSDFFNALKTRDEALYQRAVREFYKLIAPLMPEGVPAPKTLHASADDVCPHCGEVMEDSEVFGRGDRFFHRPCVSKGPLTKGSVSKQAIVRVQARRDYDGTGAELGTLYHAGKKRVKEVDPDKLQTNDPGYYGEGFYTALSPESVETYGPVVSTYTVKPEARVLFADYRMAKVDPALIEAVRSYVAQLPGIKKKPDIKLAIEEEMRTLAKNQIEWVHRVDEFAEANVYDVVVYSPDEVVVKNPEVLTYVKPSRPARTSGTGFEQLNTHMEDSIEHHIDVTVRHAMPKPKDVKSDSVVVVIPLPESIAKQFPEHDHDATPPHITVVYIGEVAAERIPLLEEVVTKVTADIGPIEVTLRPGVEQLHHHNTTYDVKGVDAPGLPELHSALQRALEDADFEVSDDLEYFPHATLTKGESFDEEPPEGAFVSDHIEIWGIERREQPRAQPTAAQQAR